MAAYKTSCPVTRAQFAAHAKPMDVVVDGVTYTLDPRTFSTNSLGWYANAKGTVTVDGVKVPVQVGMTFTAIGSKDLPQA